MNDFFKEKKFWLILTLVHSLWLLSDLLSGQETTILVSRFLVLLFLIGILAWDWEKWKK